MSYSKKRLVSYEDITVSSYTAREKRCHIPKEMSHSKRDVTSQKRCHIPKETYGICDRDLCGTQKETCVVFKKRPMIYVKETCVIFKKRPASRVTKDARYV